MTNNRWKCGHCGAEGWGALVPHDKPHGVSCRESGQLSECEISRKLRSAYAMEDRIAKARGDEETSRLRLIRDCHDTSDVII